MPSAKLSQHSWQKGVLLNSGLTHFDIIICNKFLVLSKNIQSFPFQIHKYQEPYTAVIYFKNGQTWTGTGLAEIEKGKIWVDSQSVKKAELITADDSGVWDTKR